MTHATIALVIAQPGPLRNSLLTLLSTMPEIEIVAEVKNFAALQHAGEELQPDLILIEAGATLNGLPEVLHHFKQRWKNTRTIVLVETTKHQETAAAAGADVVLLKGFRATRLIEQIQSLIAVNQ
jgi:DNA-binding NarL/FixJ family response regulator